MSSENVQDFGCDPGTVRYTWVHNEPPGSINFSASLQNCLPSISFFDALNPVV